jgi:Flp pilus assembly protein TadG
MWPSERRPYEGKCFFSTGTIDSTVFLRLLTHFLERFYMFNVSFVKYCGSSRPSGRDRGSALVELTLLLPWFLFLFVGAIDMGFYGYALVTLQSATRVAALYTSSTTATSTDSATACFYALEELKSNINMSGIVTCGGSSPVTVTATNLPLGPDLNPAAQVTVTYTTPQLFPIPGIMKGQFTISRIVKMRIRG